MADLIGGLAVINIQGSTGFLTQDLRNITRPGVDGTAVSDEGIHGNEFQVTSTVDAIDMLDAYLIFQTYKSLEGSVIDMQRAGIPLFGYLVMRVDGFEPVQLVNARGGIQNGQVLLRATWTLLPI